MKTLMGAVLISVSLLVSGQEPCYVVTDYECLVPPLYGTKELQELVQGYLSLIKAVARTDRIFITDLNSDGSPEYFVPVTCGATGNCTYYIFADHPARILGEVNGKRIIFTPSKDYPEIRTLGVSGMMMALITTYMYSGGYYRPIDEEPLQLFDSIDPSKPQEIHEFLMKVGGTKCECHQES